MVVQGHWKWRRSILVHWSVIVKIALVPFFQLLTLNNIVTLKSELEITQGHVVIESLGAVSYWPSIVTMALSCIISEIKRHIDQKSWFVSYPLAFDTPVRESRSEYCHPVWQGKTRVVCLPTRWWKKIEDTFSRFDRMPACDRQTDRQTDWQTSFHGIVRAMHTRRAVKISYIGSTLTSVAYFC